MPRNENAVFYQLFLQTPEAEAALGRDLRRTFRSQFYSLSGDMPQSAGVFAAGMVPRKGFSLTDPASLPTWITESDIDVYVAEFTRSGFRDPLNWWRNLDRGWELMAAFDGAGHCGAVDRRSKAPPCDYAAGLRTLDAAGTCSGGQRRHDRLPPAGVKDLS
jgi:hypothetical protein